MHPGSGYCSEEGKKGLIEISGVIQWASEELLTVFLGTDLNYNQMLKTLAVRASKAHTLTGTLG